jgi:hypothetical protein
VGGLCGGAGPLGLKPSKDEAPPEQSARGFLRFGAIGGALWCVMWTCRHCGLEVMFRAVEPQRDDEGYFFVCPGCDGRNQLVRFGRRGPRNPVEFEQPDP